MSTAESGSTGEPDPVSFTRSFWLAFALPWTLAHTVLDGTATWLALHGAPLVPGSGVLLIAWPVTVGLLAWGAVRTWRAAAAHAAAGHAPLWRWSALITMTAALVFTAATLALKVLPRAPQAWQHAQGRDVLEPARLSTSPQGRAWRLQGGFDLGDGARIAALLRPHQGPKLLELQLDHGHRAEA